MNSPNFLIRFYYFTVALYLNNWSPEHSRAYPSLLPLYIYLLFKSNCYFAVFIQINWNTLNLLQYNCLDCKQNKLSSIIENVLEEIRTTDSNKFESRIFRVTGNEMETLVVLRNITLEPHYIFNTRTTLLLPEETICKYNKSKKIRNVTSQMFKRKPQVVANFLRTTWT